MDRGGSGIPSHYKVNWKGFLENPYVCEKVNFCVTKMKGFQPQNVFPFINYSNYSQDDDRDLLTLSILKLIVDKCVLSLKPPVTINKFA